MRLIGIIGRKYYGKDTVADYIVNKFGYTKVSFATPLKESTRPIFGFSDEQLYGDLKDTIDPFWGIPPREVFKFLGTDVYRNNIETILPKMKNDFWLKVFDHKYKNIDKLVIADVRFPNEAQYIIDNGGFLIKLNRNIENNDGHESETSIDNINNYHVLVENNADIPSLYAEINIIITNLLQQP
jgi:hypothetical protein